MRLKVIALTTVFLLSSVNAVLAVEETSDSTVDSSKIEESAPIIPTEEAYLQNISDAKTISSEEFVELLKSGKEFNLFLGRKTCPHCRAFSLIIHDTIPLLTREMYYLNVENEINEEAMKFFQENKIGGVPTILFIAKGKIISGWVGDGITKEQLLQILNIQVPENIDIDNDKKQETTTEEIITSQKEEVNSSNNVQKNTAKVSKEKVSMHRKNSNNDMKIKK